MFYDDYETGQVMYCKQCYTDRPTRIGTDGTTVACTVCGFNIAPLDSRDEGGGYERVVTAALAETQSKFRLAEALALDIPPRRRGGSVEDGEKITPHLERARQAIINAGGEERAVGTFRDYRLTALWVAESSGGNPTTFHWVPGASFTAHDEARHRGIAYADFAANPRTIRQTRQALGASSPEIPATVVGSWTREQKAEAARELMADEDVADEAMLQPGPHRSHAITAVSRAHAREDLERSRPESRERNIQDELDDHVVAIMKYRAVTRNMHEWAAVLQRSEMARSDPDAWVSMIRGLHNRLDVIEGIVHGRSLDAELAEILGGAE